MSLGGCHWFSLGKGIVSEQLVDLDLVLGEVLAVYRAKPLDKLQCVIEGFKRSRVFKSGNESRFSTSLTADCSNELLANRSTGGLV